MNKNDLQTYLSRWSSRIPISEKSLARIILWYLLLSLTPAMAQTIPCTELNTLIDQSESGFYSIQHDSRSQQGGFNTTTILPEAEYCMIFEDPEKRTYQCTWAYSFGASQASTTFEQYVKNISDCLGNRAIKLKDQAVNHPDTYSSYLYQLAETEVRVTLKNKSQLKSTLVSVFVAAIP